MTPERLAECKKICACVPFIDNGAGVTETQQAMGELITVVEVFIARIAVLEAAVYHTRPDEMMFGGEGWTWKQQARATEDRLKEAEARIEQLETALTGTLAPMERCGLLAVADNVRVIVGTKTTLGGTTDPNEKARNP